MLSPKKAADDEEQMREFWRQWHKMMNRGAAG
jgi:hypothetical protein